MRITVKTAAIESGPLAAFSGDGGEVEAAEGATLGEVLVSLGVKGKDRQAYVSLVNDAVVAENMRSRHRLEENDAITVFPPLKGG